MLVIGLLLVVLLIGSFVVVFGHKKVAKGVLVLSGVGAGLFVLTIIGIGIYNWNDNRTLEVYKPAGLTLQELQQMGAVPIKEPAAASTPPDPFPFYDDSRQYAWYDKHDVPMVYRCYSSMKNPCTPEQWELAIGKTEMPPSGLTGTDE